MRCWQLSSVMGRDLQSSGSSSENSQAKVLPTKGKSFQAKLTTMSSDHMLLGFFPFLAFELLSLLFYSQESHSWGYHFPNLSYPFLWQTEMVFVTKKNCLGCHHVLPLDEQTHNPLWKTVSLQCSQAKLQHHWIRNQPTYPKGPCWR